MALNGNLCQTSFGAPGRVPRSGDITELQGALARLEAARPLYNNCDCAPSNVCQSCQSVTCQSQCNCNCDCIGNGSG